MQPTGETPRREKPPISHWALPIAVAVLFCTTAISLAFLVHSRRQAQNLTAANKTLNASLGQVQEQLQSVTARLNTLSAPPENASRVTPAAQPPQDAAPLPRPHAMARTRAAKAHRPRSEDPRWESVQDQLADQQKAIASTREEVDKARQDLQGQLTSTHDELSGSIARTHEELVALEKRGERRYVEFHLDKSKQFQRVGPVGLSLRKADIKHRSYNLALLVEDQQLQKKSVNLYEPIWISVSDRPEPVELVVNEIRKDLVKGYLSESKYKKSELASTGAPDRGPQLQPPPQQ